MNQHQVYTGNRFIPYSYSQGGIQYVSVYIPFSTDALWENTYEYTVREEVIERDNRVVAMRPVPVVGDKPVQTRLVTRSAVSSYTVPNVRMIKVRSRTFSWVDIRNRMKKLGVVLDDARYMYSTDGTWDTWSDGINFCGSKGHIVDYKPKSFVKRTRRVDKSVDVDGSAQVVQKQLPNSDSKISPDQGISDNYVANPSSSADIEYHDRGLPPESWSSTLDSTNSISYDVEPNGNQNFESKDLGTRLHVTKEQPFKMNGLWYVAAQDEDLVYNPATGRWRTETIKTRDDTTSATDYSDLKMKQIEEYYNGKTSSANSASYSSSYSTETYQSGSGWDSRGYSSSRSGGEGSTYTRDDL